MFDAEPANLAAGGAEIAFESEDAAVDSSVGAPPRELEVGEIPEKEEPILKNTRQSIRNSQGVQDFLIETEFGVIADDKDDLLTNDPDGPLLRSACEPNHPWSTHRQSRV
jgi:hypothetical protein